jgi:hypothetical protein
MAFVNADGMIPDDAHLVSEIPFVVKKTYCRQNDFQAHLTSLRTVDNSPFMGSAHNRAPGACSPHPKEG